VLKRREYQLQNFTKYLVSNICRAPIPFFATFSVFLNKKETSIHVLGNEETLSPDVGRVPPVDSPDVKDETG
jgi:hypothetical protein